MFRAFLVTLSSIFLMSACGGGSSYSPAPPASPPPPPGDPTGLVVTTANAKPAARVAYGSTLQSMETGGLVGDSGIAGSSNGGFQKPGGQSGPSGALSRILQKIPLGPDTYPCGVSGTQTISGELASLFGLTTGDTINVDAVDCDDGLGEVINGRMEMTVVTYTSDPVLGLLLLEMDVMLIDFEVVTATDTILSNGDSLVSMDMTGNPLIAVGIGGNSMTVTSNAGTDVMTNFDTSQTVDASVQPEPYTLSSFGTVDSSQLTGIISFTTPVTFQGAGAGYPFAGELLITGADGGTIRLIALDATNVRIETDTNGDGTVDDTEDTTWDDVAL